MANNIKIRKVIKSKLTIEGAGDYLQRAFRNSKEPLFDPFLLLDVFRSDEPRYFLKGFPPPIRRGIETITYVFAGDVGHGDSTDNKGVIGSGDVQWRTDGNGSTNQEMPEGDSIGTMHGFQLWANLPASYKMRDPRYRGILDREIPSVAVSGGATIKVIAGKLNGTVGPMQDIVTDPEYLDVTIPPYSKFIHHTMSGHIVFAYIIEGNGLFCKEENTFSYEGEVGNYFDIQEDPLIGNSTLVLFDDGEQVYVLTEKDPVRFLLVSGKPIGEPIAWYGPIVMNTREELQMSY